MASATFVGFTDDFGSGAELGAGDHGDWFGVFGTKAYALATGGGANSSGDYEIAVDSAISSFSLSNATYYDWGNLYNTVSLRSPLQGSRQAATWYSVANLSYNFTLAESRRVSVHSADYDSAVGGTRRQFVEVYSGGTLLSSKDIGAGGADYGDFRLGVYTTWDLTAGSYELRVTNNGIPNCVSMGIFFDEVPGDRTIAAGLDFDASVYVGLDNLHGSSTSWRHRNAGNILFVFAFGDTLASDATGNNVTGCTFNGVAMTEVLRTSRSGDRWVYLFRLVSPYIGLASVLLSYASGIEIGAESCSYYHAATDQSAAVSYSSTSAGGVSDIYAVTATVAANSWLVGATKLAVNDHAYEEAGTGTVLRYQGIGFSLFDSGANLAAGSRTISDTTPSRLNAHTVFGVEMLVMVSGLTVSVFELSTGSLVTW